MEGYLYHFLARYLPVRESTSETKTVMSVFIRATPSKRDTQQLGYNHSGTEFLIFFKVEYFHNLRILMERNKV